MFLRILCGAFILLATICLLVFYYLQPTSKSVGYALFHTEMFCLAAAFAIAMVEMPSELEKA